MNFSKNDLIIALEKEFGHVELDKHKSTVTTLYNSVGTKDGVGGFLKNRITKKYQDERTKLFLNKVALFLLDKNLIENRYIEYFKNTLTSDKENTEIEYPFDILVVQKKLGIMKNAFKRGLEFNLTETDIRKLLNQKTCYYTRVELNNEQGHKNSRTFDRIDHKKGYVKGNVVACSLQANQLKNYLFELKERPFELTPHELAYMFSKIELSLEK